MDAPPSTCTTNNGEPFISFKTNPLPEYVPKYQWNDDERSSKAYINYSDGDDKYIEYVPVFQVMKEYYDEEKRALYRQSSWSTIDDMEYWDYESETYEPVANWSEDNMSPQDDSKYSLPQQKEQDNLKTSINENIEDVIDVSPGSNKFIYT
jgi:hypothetical protein